jgi:two-component system, NtrC family, response regulator GlrR
MEQTTGTRVVRQGAEIFKTMRRYRLRLPDGVVVEPASTRIRIGSQRDNDVVLADPSVSRAHAELVADDDGLRMRDLGSTNGTFVDGVRVRDVYLHPGARIAIGSVQLSLEAMDGEIDVPLHGEPRFCDLLGQSGVMRQLFALLARVARSHATVLIEGESGTGKELVAEAIHAESGRRGPFVVFDCATVPPNLMEATLFGYERGAFTGAVVSRRGRLAEADGGTLFLDEIGELPLDLQSKLLRVLERREIRPLGGERSSVDVRIVAATNRELAAMVNRDAFRADLYYRLAVVVVTIPPLRERTEDIPLLVRTFLGELMPDEPGRAAASYASIGAASWPALERYGWPGNVRELRNVVERAVAFAGDDLVTDVLPGAPLSALSPDELPASGPEIRFVVDASRPYPTERARLLDRFERLYVEALLAEHGGQVVRAARAAGIDRTYLRRLVVKHGIE